MTGDEERQPAVHLQEDNDAHKRLALTCVDVLVSVSTRPPSSIPSSCDVHGIDEESCGGFVFATFSDVPKCTFSDHHSQLTSQLIRSENQIRQELFNLQSQRGFSVTIFQALATSSSSSMACQICLEDFSDIFTEDPGITRVQQLCGADSDCTANVCSRCLVQHIQTTLDACIRGLLPRVRCPICLRAIGKAQWIKFAPTSSLLIAEYEQLAACALSLTPPCCHAANYTHLPECCTSVDMPISVSTLTGSRDPITGLQTLLEDFARHRMDASRVIAFLDDALGSDLEWVIDNILNQFYDDERRASLYLSYLCRYPEETTRCCGKSFCFNCKGTQCGLVCGTNDGFDEVACMVRCRQCRVMLVVTDGCDSVDCVCGFEMSWENELRYRDMAAKDLFSIDILDLQLMDTWLVKREILGSHLATHCAVVRRKRLTRLIDANKPILQRCLMLWRRRRVNTSTASTNCGDVWEERG